MLSEITDSQHLSELRTYQDNSGQDCRVAGNTHHPPKRDPPPKTSEDAAPQSTATMAWNRDTQHRPELSRAYTALVTICRWWATSPSSTNNGMPSQTIPQNCRSAPGSTPRYVGCRPPSTAPSTECIHMLFPRTIPRSAAAPGPGSRCIPTH